MFIEIERSGWENLLNIVNYLCLGKPVAMRLVDGSQQVTLAQADYFHGIETYLKNSNPLMAVVLGKENHVSLGYFLKDPQKVTIEEVGQNQIKSILIETSENKKAVIDFILEKPRKIVYHQDISRGKAKKTKP